MRGCGSWREGEKAATESSDASEHSQGGLRKSEARLGADVDVRTTREGRPLLINRYACIIREATCENMGEP